MRIHPSGRGLALLMTLFVSAALAACASGGGGSDGPRRNPNVISADELVEHTTLNALDVVRRLRPRWLQGRGGGTSGSNSPVVFLDGARMGNIDELQRLSVSDIESLRFLNSRDATTRYGTNMVAGAIEVRSRAR